MKISSRDIAIAAAKAAIDKKATDIKVLHIGPFSSVADYFVLCSAGSDRQVKAIADSVLAELRKLGSRSLGVEGVDEGMWAILDMNDVVVHVFHESRREYYRLDEMWSQVERVTIPAEIYQQAAKA